MTYRESEIPCFSCNERYIGCHGKCDQYASYLRKNEERKKEIFLIKENNIAAIEHSMRGAKKSGRCIKNIGF